jgi:hypothetical protein
MVPSHDQWCNINAVPSLCDTKDMCVMMMPHPQMTDATRLCTSGHLIRFAPNSTLQKQRTGCPSSILLLELAWLRPEAAPAQICQWLWNSPIFNTITLSMCLSTQLALYFYTLSTSFFIKATTLTQVNAISCLNHGSCIHSPLALRIF